MQNNRGFLKNTIRLLIVTVIVGSCIAVGYAAPTVAFATTEGAITTGSPILVNLNGLGVGDAMTMTVGTTKNAATSYVPNFDLPFNMTDSSITVTGTNVNTMSISVTAPAPDGNTYTRTNVVPPSTLTSHATLYKGMYVNRGVTINPTDASQSTNVGVTVTGTASEAMNHGQLQIQTNGATPGTTITVTVNGVTGTYYIPTSNNVDGGTGDTGGPGAAAGNAQLGALESTNSVSVTGTGSTESGSLSANDVDGMTGASASWTTTSTSTPTSGATITTTISKEPPAETLAAFQTAFQVQGAGVDAVAYTMTVSKNGVTSTGPATVTMSVSKDWVDAHGGLSAMTITRQGDDGVVSSQSPSWTYDAATGMYTFTATFNEGLCIFALIAVKSTAATAGTVTVTTTTSEVIPSATVPPTSNAAVETSGTPSAAATKTPVSLFVPLSALVIAIAGLALWRKQ